MRRAARVDATQRYIVAAFRRLGCAVWLTHTAGSGAPDAVVGIKGAKQAMNVLIEIKTAKGRLTPDEQAWHDAWPAHVEIVRSVDEAIALVQRVRRTHG